MQGLYWRQCVEQLPSRKDVLTWLALHETKALAAAGCHGCCRSGTVGTLGMLLLEHHLLPLQAAAGRGDRAARLTFHAQLDEPTYIMLKPADRWEPPTEASISGGHTQLHSAFLRVMRAFLVAKRASLELFY